MGASPAGLPALDRLTGWHLAVSALSIVVAALLLAVLGYRIALNVDVWQWWLPIVFFAGVAAADCGIGARALGRRHLGPGRLSGHGPSPAGAVPRPPRQPGRLPAAAIPGHQRRRGLHPIPDSLALQAVPLEPRVGRAVAVFGFGFCGIGSMTNQIHQWAHMPAPPAPVGRCRRAVSCSATPNTPRTTRGRTTGATASRPAGATRRWRRSDSSVASNLRSPGVTGVRPPARRSALRSAVRLGGRPRWRPAVADPRPEPAPPAQLALRNGGTDVIRLRLHQRRRSRRCWASPASGSCSPCGSRSTFGYAELRPLQSLGVSAGRDPRDAGRRRSCSARSAPGCARTRRWRSPASVSRWRRPCWVARGCRFGGDAGRSSWLGVDFFVLNLVLYSAVFIPLERLFALRAEPAGLSPSVAGRPDLLLHQLAADRGPDDPHADAGRSSSSTGRASSRSAARWARCRCRPRCWHCCWWPISPSTGCIATLSPRRGGSGAFTRFTTPSSRWTGWPGPGCTWST